MKMTLQSTAFRHEGDIPARHTCEGQDLSPPLSWSNLPEGTRSLALIVDDPDAPDPAAPQRTHVHWLVYNIPTVLCGMGEGVKDELPRGARAGRNDWGQAAYGGPCPPVGKHRYFFKLYALDAKLPDLGHPDKATLEAALQGHVLDQAVLVGLYQKGGQKNGK